MVYSISIYLYSIKNTRALVSPLLIGIEPEEGRDDRDRDQEQVVAVVVSLDQDDDEDDWVVVLVNNGNDNNCKNSEKKEPVCHKDNATMIKERRASWDPRTTPRFFKLYAD